MKKEADSKKSFLGSPLFWFNGKQRATAKGMIRSI
jgi:hypothetical protein